ncbi:putative endo-polygalacturonase [Helianthus annuus]|uniref:endo-polygalacturonase n=1 Tax=Helianthus annuus TaxID=4232 RepID=A0A251VNY2_HELAN|nr:polygalacturonase QRT2 [Helianthus annuus]KAF5822401.1 putative polygalacturonase [Helianthus annuus]KAJ0611878.1 putative endo-polygalacturonase [Helianthus annuus]KAJ0623110.1 putative endo-polygalacturonase [Helianthus annuus]KAJ0627238.1 putative endo-polygalacturonase [Helianthus annuus]KAJ0783549.1 putative endo-polygalacturonase [Helianthus annuus]
MHLHKHLVILLTILGSTLSCSSYGTHHQPIKPTRNLLARASLKPWPVNVDHYGAMANGTDDSDAFREAWRSACSSSKGTEFVVPKNKVYHLKPIKFSGPCNPNLKVKIYGTIKASSHRSDYEKDRRHWIVFEDLEDLTVEGGGTINGNGRIWWIKSCKVDETQPCIGAPTAVSFRNCTRLRVNNIRIKNPQQMHLTFQNSINVRASNLRIIAPANSPNTDGIHITASQNVQVFNSLVKTGDDCVSIVDGSRNIVVRKLTCGPGHGISIGSLGKNNSEDKVSNILVDKAIISNTTNGVRIKSWQGGSGYARNIKFQNIVMHNVTNPIIVDQNYCDRKEECPEQKSAVQMQNVVYRNIKGTSNSEVAINFDCSKTFPCQAILLENIDLNRQGNEGDMKASCSNVRLTTRGKVTPRCK